MDASKTSGLYYNGKSFRSPHSIGVDFRGTCAEWVYALRNASKCVLHSAVFGTVLASVAGAADWPMLGRDATRNPVSPEANAPRQWQIELRGEQGQVTQQAKNIRWTAKLGSQTYGTPVVSQGLVWIGTNLGEGCLGGVLKCFREADGALVYEYASSGLEAPLDRAEQRNGLGGSPLIEGGNLWFTTLRREVVCLDIRPFLAGNGPPREVWKLDMIKSLGVHPRMAAMPRTCSIAAYKDRLFVVTGNGFDASFKEPAPKAPNLLCLDKATGRIAWQQASHGADLLASQLAEPLTVEIDGRGQVIVAQGQCWLRSFDAATGRLVWEFDMNLKTGIRDSVLATPVFHDNRVYVATGTDPDLGEGPGRLVCIDPTKQGDISTQLLNGAPNPNSGLLWEYTQQDQNENGRIDGFEETFHRTVGSVAIVDNWLIVADFSGLVHCLDANTGDVHWTHDLLAASLTSPLIVDDKAYVADEDGDIAIFKAAANPAEAMKNLQAGQGEPLGLVNMGASVYSSPVFANGVLYVATKDTLFAIEAD